jgi:hypothetical protein
MKCLEDPLRFPIMLLVLFTVLVGASAAEADIPPGPDELALRLLDHETLYTLGGGIKPIGDGFWHTSFPIQEASSPEVETVRRRLAQLPLPPEFQTGVLVFATPFEGKRIASAFLAHRPSLQALIQRRPDVFASLGIGPELEAQVVLEKIDRGPQAARWRAFGLVYGYPEYAIDFFVAAGESQAKDGKFVKRDFIQIPTFASEHGRFVYAVPSGHIERDEDRALKAAVKPILERYRFWRSIYVGDGRAGSLALLRDWVAPPVTTPSYVQPVSKATLPRRATFLRCWPQHSFRYEFATQHLGRSVR